MSFSFVAPDPNEWQFNGRYWAMRDASGTQARAVYGSDVPASPVDAPAFETIWASRATTPAG